MALAAGGTLALVAVGCGNEKRDFRIQKLEPIVHQVAARRTALADTLRAAQPGRKGDARLLRAELLDLGASIRRVGALTPPPGTERQFRLYARANQALLASLAKFVDMFAAGGGLGLNRAGDAARAAAAAANRAELRLEHALG